jgi:hypothetical protein
MEVNSESSRGLGGSGRTSTLDGNCGSEFLEALALGDLDPDIFLDDFFFFGGSAGFAG